MMSPSYSTIMMCEELHYRNIFFVGVENGCSKILACVNFAGGLKLYPSKCVAPFLDLHI